MLYIVRLSGEIMTKSNPVSSRFQQQLRENITTAFTQAGLSCTIRHFWGRIYVETTASKATDILSRVFGIVSFSPVEANSESTIEDILQIGEEVYTPKVANQTFGVRARHMRHPTLKGSLVERELGAKLAGASKGVNLTNPDLWVRVEVGKESSYFYSQSFQGAGGLPVGTGGKVLVLLSGGFDSVAAAWMLLKRGVAVEYLLCNMSDKSYERSVLRVAKKLHDLWGYGSAGKFHSVNFLGLSQVIVQKVTERYRQVVLKRQFYGMACYLAKQVGAEAIVTGECIGQVSSQTLANLAVIENGCLFPVLRPLISYDKLEIINLCRKIGTHDLSESIPEFCSLVPRRPATSAKLDIILEEEASLEDQRFEKTYQSCKTFDLAKLKSIDLSHPYVFCDSIPQGAIFIDCRTEEEFAVSHLDGALHFPFYEAMDQCLSLDRKKVYVIYCSIGQQSAVIANKMQENNYRAFSLRGGYIDLDKNYPESQKIKKQKR